MKWRECGVELWRGVTNPSLGALVIIVAINLSGVVGLLLGLETLMIHGGDRLLAENPFDQDIYVTSEALRLSRSDSSRPFVAVLGGSSVRHMFFKDDLQRQLRDLTQNVVDVYNLTTSRQSIWEMVTLVDMIPPDTKGIVVIEAALGPFAFGQGDLKDMLKTPRLGFRSRYFDEELKLAGLEPSFYTGIYSLDNYRFYMSRLSTWLTRLHSMPVEQVESAFLGPNPHPMVQKWEGQPYSDRLNQHRNNVEANVTVLDRLARRLSQTRLKLVLLDAPVNQRFLHNFHHEEDWLDHRRRMSQFAAQHEVPFLTVVEEARVKDTDYYDYCHLTSRKAVAKITTILADHLTGLLEDLRSMEHLQ